MNAKEKASLIEAAKNKVVEQVTTREKNKSVYFESTLPNGTVFTVGKDSLPIPDSYAGHTYYRIKTTTNQDIVLSKLAEKSVDKVFDLIGNADFKLRADLISEIPAFSKKDGSKYLKRIFEYVLIENESDKNAD
jgi:hypothetical protein